MPIIDLTTLANIYTDWITAIGTVAATVVALGIAIGLQLTQRRDARELVPKLSLVRDHNSRNAHAGWTQIRLAVTNDAGRHAAHDVLVSIDEVTDGGGTFSHPVNAALQWTGLMTPAERERPMTVPAGARRYIDIGEFIQTHDEHLLPLPTFKPAVFRGYYEMSALQLSPMIFRLTITAENCDSTSWVATVTYDQRPGEAKPVNADVTVAPA